MLAMEALAISQLQEANGVFCGEQYVFRGSELLSVDKNITTLLQLYFNARFMATTW
ncbi:hypothetical protein M4D58_22235 [Brevibacillus borstelensis]|nr:hypothetical protein [Brevibacillus borstelensis]MCM3593348.1 hypothetical protein [Brevibacillus borstelensis]